MKTSKNYLKTIAKTLACTAALSVVITACSKKEDPSPQVQPGKLALIHASSHAPELALYAGGVKVDMKDFIFGKTVDYQNAGPGAIDFSISKTDVKDEIVKRRFTFKASKNYSLFVVDTLATSSTLQFVEDDLTAPASDKAKVRFINLSQDLGAVDFDINGQAAALFTKQDFRQATNYMSIDPNAAYTFEIKANGTTTVLASLPATKIEKGKLYTIYAKGLKSVTTGANKLSLALITNK